MMVPLLTRIDRFLPWSGLGLVAVAVPAAEAVVAAPREAAAALDLPTGAPMLHIERVAYTYGEVPAELRRSWNDTRSHHYRNRINN